MGNHNGEGEMDGNQQVDKHKSERRIQAGKDAGVIKGYFKLLFTKQQTSGDKIIRVIAWAFTIAIIAILVIAVMSEPLS
jgi:hypothetical protein